jgi:acyl carrier protein
VDVRPTEEELRDWLIEQVAVELQLPEDAIDPQAPLETFGLESLAVAALQAELSDRLGYRLPHTLFFDLPTIDAVARHLAEADASDDPGESREDARVSRNGSPALILGLAPARPFFCLGGVVGAAHYLRPLARAAGHEPFYGVQAPGLDGAEPPPRRIEDLAARYVEEIRTAQPHGPYRLGGHSFGGLVAYEIGRKLRAAGDCAGAVRVRSARLGAAGTRGLRQAGAQGGSEHVEVLGEHREVVPRNLDDPQLRQVEVLPSVQGRVGVRIHLPAGLHDLREASGGLDQGDGKVGRQRLVVHDRLEVGLVDP